MKYLKAYESKKGPQIGDYVVCKDSLFEEDEMVNFFANNIGRYIKRNTPPYHYALSEFKYIIRYKNVPKDLRSQFEVDIEDRFIRGMRRDEILFFSSNKEDCEIFINAKKYNL